MSKTFVYCLATIIIYLCVIKVKGSGASTENSTEQPTEKTDETVKNDANSKLDPYYFYGGNSAMIPDTRGYTN